MVKNILILFFVLIVIGGGVYYFLNKNQTATDTNEQKMEGVPLDDEMIIEVDEKDVASMMGMTYQYVGELIDVTKGEIRGINTQGLTKGIAKSNFDGEQYLLLATFENLPEPAGDDFYEGWIVQLDPFMFLSTGIVKKVDGVYTNVYKSGEDLTNYNFYVLTIEPNDGDPAPADHIVEGTMQ